MAVDLFLLFSRIAHFLKWLDVYYKHPLLQGQALGC